MKIRFQSFGLKIPDRFDRVYIGRSADIDAGEKLLSGLRRPLSSLSMPYHTFVHVYTCTVSKVIFP